MTICRGWGKVRGDKEYDHNYRNRNATIINHNIVLYHHAGHQLSSPMLATHKQFCKSYIFSSPDESL